MASMLFLSKPGRHDLLCGSEDSHRLLTENLRLVIAAVLRIPVEETTRIVNRFCWQRATFHFRLIDAPRPSGVSNMWALKPLGAMCLQMYWFLTSNSQLRRCEYFGCRLPIPLARTGPKGRRT